MWPMTHALYTGLNEAGVERRPSTSESIKTWYGNNRKSYVSTFSYHYDNRQSVYTTRGDELPELINRSQQVLNVLNFDEEQEAKRSQSQQSGEYNGGEGPSTTATRGGTIASRGSVYVAPQGHGLDALEEEERRNSEGDTTTQGVSTVAPSLHATSSIKGKVPASTVASSFQGSHQVSGSVATTTNTAGLDTATVFASSRVSYAPGHHDHIDVLNNQYNTTAAPSVAGGFESIPPHMPEPARVKTLLSDDGLSQADSEFREKYLAQNPPAPSPDGEEDDDPSTRLTGLPLLSVTVALSAAVFLVAMDVNVIATAVPRITGEFRSLDDVGWYGSSFLMATCATQIPYGRIYTVFPAKWVFTSAILIFMIGSLIAGLSPSSPVLIFGRAVQGLGTSGILSGGLIIMSKVVPLRLRPVLTGAIGAMEGVAMISAPVIGGVLTDKLHWRWCFYINLPIGGFVLLVVLLCLRSFKDTSSGMQMSNLTWLQILYKLDVLGAVSLLPPIVCILLALHIAGTSGHFWSDNDVILLFVLGAVLFCVFGYLQHRNADVAMIPARVIKHRAVIAGFWFITCISSALVVITYFLPLWFQTVGSTSASDSGVGILPMLVAVIIGIIGSGALVSMFGYYTPFMLASSLLMPVGLGLLTTIKPDTSKAALLAFPAIFGLGVGIGFQQPLVGVQAALPQNDIPAGTSIIVFGQAFGAAIIIAAGETLFQSRLLANLANNLGITGVVSNELLGHGQNSLSATVPKDKLDDLILTVNDSFTETFYLAVALAALSVFGALFMEWKSVKQPKKVEEEVPPVMDSNLSVKAAA